MKKWLVLALATLTLVGRTTVFAQDHGNAPDHWAGKKAGHHEGWKGHEHDQLGLSDAQKKQMHAIMAQLKQNILPLRIEEKKKHLELAELFLQPEPDKTAVDQKVQEINDLRSKRSQVFIDAHFQMLALLTPEQKQKFSQFMASRMMCDGRDSCRHMHHHDMEQHGRMHHGHDGSR